MLHLDFPAVQGVQRGGRFYVFCVCASLFIAVARPGEIFPILSSLRLGLVSVLVTSATFLAVGGWEAVKEGHFVGAKRLAALNLLCLATIPFSIWLGYSLEVIRVILLYAVLYFCALPAVRQAGRLQAIVLALALAVAFLVTVMLFVPSAVSFDAPGRIRVGESYDSNDVAMFLATIFPFVAFLFVKAEVMGKFAWGALLGGLVLAVLKTGSRGGLIALGAAVVLLLVSFGKGFKLWHKILIVALAIGFFMTPAADTTRERFRDVFSGEDYNLQTSEDREQGRLAIWLRGLQLIKEHPIVGVGVGNTTTAMGIKYGSWTAVHNAYLQVAIEIGLAGVVVFASLLWTIWRNCGHALRLFEQHPDARWLAILPTYTIIALVAYMFAALFLSQAYSVMLPILLLISDGLRDIATQLEEADAELHGCVESIQMETEHDC